MDYFEEFYGLENHKKSDSVKWIISFILIFLLLVSMSGAWYFILKDRKDEENKESPSEETATVMGDMGVTVKDTQTLSIQATAVTSETQYNTVQLTATIYPEDVTNKAVDWTIGWQTPDSEYATGKEVTDYCTVTPESSGALTAKVQCLKPFVEYIDVKVTTREGGYTAVCTVSYVGKPSSFTISSEEVSQSGGYYDLGVGNLYSIYNFDLNLNNEWNQVGEQFYDFTVEIKGYGDFVVQDKAKDTYDSEFYWSGEESTFLANDWKDTFLETEVTSEKKLKIIAKKTVKNFGSERVIPGGGRIIEDAYKSGGDSVYFDITVKTSTGLSKTIKIRLVSSVTGVQLNKPGIEF